MMKKLLTIVLSAAAIAVPFCFCEYCATNRTKCRYNREKAKGVWIDVRSGRGI